MEYMSILLQHHAGPTGDVLIVKNAEGQWEFPHARIRVNEPDSDAVVRIATEKLGLKVKAGKLVLIGHKRPSDGTVEHIVCGNITHNTNTKCDYHKYYEAVDTWQKEPNIDGEYRWVHPSELGSYEFAGDDKSFMDKYDPWVKGSFIPDRRMN